jgi:hypothetical protein
VGHFRSVGPTDRSAGLLVGRTHLLGTVVSLVSGDPGVPMSHWSMTSFSPRVTTIRQNSIKKTSSICGG